MNKLLALAFLGALTLCLAACRGDIFVDDSPAVPAGTPDPDAESFYLLNEGNMGSNRASIDFYDALDGSYSRNIFTAANPGEVKELGDVGNDLSIYGSKMYAVINCSHKVQVMRASDCRSLGKIDIPNPRYVVGHGDFVYVSSYVSPVQVDPKAPVGAVFRVDTLSLSVIDRVDVGYQPEQMAVIGNRLYVANSGGYRAPNYDRTISVISLETFAVVATFDVAPNLHRLAADSLGRLLVTSRGDYADDRAWLYAVDPATGNILARSDVEVSNFALRGDTIYSFASAHNDITGVTSIAYNSLDARSLARTGSFISDSLARQIRMPYAIAVGPRTGNIYLTDARNYVSSGRLHCLRPDGTRLWTVTTGDIPCSIAFEPK